MLQYNEEIWSNLNVQAKIEGSFTWHVLTGLIQQAQLQLQQHSPEGPPYLYLVVPRLFHDCGMQLDSVLWLEQHYSRTRPFDMLAAGHGRRHGCSMHGSA